MEPVKEGTPGTGVNQYALWYLIQNMDGFPVKDQGTVGYTEERNYQGF